MNPKIREILEKHEPNAEWWFKATKININKAIIEICEEQKKECAEHLYDANNRTELLLLSKNIAK